ncbi:hypothetical protein [Xenorhabdus bovienii]|uniref:hypothetical protein n=1 Tax=Xenorhabdus bovienii TaxID=40576 RepID=UPI0023B2B127|nr:hypothetical protein [Xenorhabdus bovienii]MDE9454550.1 hypothetical protein [Xenorhabdus bovienii]
MSVEKGKPEIKTINCKLCGDSILSVAVHLRTSSETSKCDCAKRPVNKDGSAMTDQEAFEEYKRIYRGINVSNWFSFILTVHVCLVLLQGLKITLFMLTTKIIR